jgi:hypothetical protein
MSEQVEEVWSAFVTPTYLFWDLEAGTTLLGILEHGWRLLPNLVSFLLRVAAVIYDSGWDVEGIFDNFLFCNVKILFCLALLTLLSVDSLFLSTASIIIRKKYQTQRYVSPLFPLKQNEVIVHVDWT